MLTQTRFPIARASVVHLVCLLTMLAVAASAVSGQQATPAPGSASVFDLVDECDVLAAHPDDPERYADGLEDDLIVPGLARLACERAVQRSPTEPRFVFQFGRALLAAGRHAEAVTQFRRAADGGYGAALIYMGTAHVLGWGVAVNAATARDYYQKAAASGVNVAAELVDRLTFDVNHFASRAFLGALYRGDHDTLRRGPLDPVARNHAFNFVLALMEECGPVLSPEAVIGLYSYRFPPGFDAYADEGLNVTIQTSIGEYDGARFVARYGCEGPVADQMFRHIREFFTRR